MIGDEDEFIEDDIVGRRFFDWIDFPLDKDNQEKLASKNFNNNLRIDQACWILQHSPTIQAMCELYPNVLELPIFALDIPAGGSFETGHILLNEALPINMLVHFLAHEFRHATQQDLGVIPNQNLPKNLALIFNLLYEADAFAFQTVVAWELKGAGFPQIWNNFKNYYYGKNIAEEFQRLTQNDPNSTKTGVSLTKIFEETLEDDKIVRFYKDKFRDNFPEIEKLKYTQGVALIRNNLRKMSQMPYTVYEGDGYYRYERERYLPEEKILTLVAKQKRALGL